MWEKIDGFLDNLTWIGNGKFSLLLREYSYLAANVLISQDLLMLVHANFKGSLIFKLENFVWSLVC